MVFIIADSDIEGKGVFSTVDLPTGASVMITDYYEHNERAFNHLTNLGHKINHSYKPNSRLIKVTKAGPAFAYKLITTKPVAAMEELTVNYNTLQPTDFGKAEAGYK